MNYLKVFCAFFTVAIVFCSSLLAQESNLDVLKEKIKKITLLDTVAIEKINIPMGQEWMKMAEINANELDFGLKYRIYRETINDEYYYTILIWQKTKIIYREVFTAKENWDSVQDDFWDIVKIVEPQTIYQSYDSLQLMGVNRLYEKVYGVQMDIENLKKQIRGISYQFGYAFGGGAEPNEQGIYLIKLVKARNKGEILKWASSLLPERQAYGYIGLLLLQKQGINLTPHESQMMDFIAKKTTLVEYGYGCTGRGFLMPMKEALNDADMLKEFLQRFGYHLK